MIGRHGSVGWRRALLLGLVAALVKPVHAQTPLGSEFTFQGGLTLLGEVVDEAHDFEFALFNAETGSAQIDSTLTRDNVAVRDGRFTVTLDFGTGAFTGDALWLEVCVRPGTSTGAFMTLSPRQELRGVPYALHSLSTGGLQGRPVGIAAPSSGEVLKWDGLEWAPAADEAGGGGPAAPSISSVADVTGGLLVIGDRVDLTGANLGSVDAAHVGGKSAPIITQSATSVRIQIPEGIPNGINVVQLADLSGDVGLAATAAVNVHRMAILMGQGSGRVVIVDTTDHGVAATINQTIDISDSPCCPDFANNGSLALVPLGRSNYLIIDMTANPPASTSLSNLGATQLIGFTVHPDNDLATASDLGGNRIRGLTINDALPPYDSSSVSSASSFFFGSSQLPRCAAYMNDGILVVPLEGPDELALMERVGVNFVDTLVRVDSGVNSNPIQVKAIPSRAGFVTLGVGDDVRSYLGAGVQIEDLDPGFVIVERVAIHDLPNPIAFDLSPNGDFAFVADDTEDVVFTLRIGATTLTRIGQSDDPSGNALSSIAVDPVEGRFAYLGLDDGQNVDLFDVSGGGTLTRSAVNPLAGNNDLRDCRGIAIQP